jgi:Domain of unknown function (DUF4832)
MLVPAIILCLCNVGRMQAIDLPAGPGPLDNPLKGFASYCEPGIPLVAPVSMAYEGASWKELEPSEGKFAFDVWETKSWNVVPAAGKPVVLRVFLDYPSQPVAVPQWLIDKGVKMTHYDDFGGGSSPDYENPNLLNSLLKFIQAYGQRYDHDDRVAYIELGLLGHWGEWHTYPRTELFASEAVQNSVLKAMHKAFPDKPIMARYAYPTCRLPWLGFHDDMIPSDTMGNEDWEFLPAINKGGVASNWKVAPLGGELVPFAAKQYLGKDWPLLQEAVKEAHFTWIGPYCPAMVQDPTPEDIARIDTLIRSLGYQFRLDHAQIPTTVAQQSNCSLKVTGVNEGVAPMYAPWKTTFALIDEKGHVQQRIQAKSDPRSWLPGPFSVDADEPVSVPAGTYRIGFGIVDPASDKALVKFANSLGVVEGYTVLGTLKVLK